MQAELKTKWVEALRSGRYKQGRLQLRTDDDCYCCLGVLCEVSGKGQWVRQPVNGSDSECWAYRYGDHSFSGVLPYQLEVESGLSVGGYEVGTGRLIEMNDEDRKTFAEIADFIETKR